MNDEVLESVRKSLAPVHMDRPLEMIEARGRAYRRNRLAGLAGLGLSVGLGLTLALSTTVAPHGDDKAPQTTASAGQVAQRIDLAAFTLSSGADGTVVVHFKEAAADPKALEKALADAGVTAFVRVNGWCSGSRVRGEAQEARLSKLFQLDRPDGPRGGLPTMTIHAADIPKNVVPNISMFTDEHKVVRGAGVLYFRKNAQTQC